MDYFIDTNIALGYSFKCDKWHNCAFNIVSNNLDKINWSNTVEMEFNKKFKEIYEFIRMFLDNMNDLIQLESQMPVNYYSFEKYILNNTQSCKLDIFKKVKIIEFFWDRYNGNFENNIEMQFNFLEFSKLNLSQYKSMRNELQYIVKLYDCGLDNFKNYPKLVRKLTEEIGIHNPDYKITIDCHDFSIKNRIDVIFLTSDKRFFNKVRDLEFLKIKKYELCN
jgi:hypothetical protein